MSPVTVLLILAVIPSIILHEVSHGLVALRFGDTTARDAGRLTLNPISHIDPVGTILLPVMMAIAHLPAIGYAKPVPVNINNLRDPRRQSVYVSLVGPLTNISIAAIAWLIFRLAHPTDVVYAILGTPATYNIWLFLFLLGVVNTALALINLLPIPPLDGSALIESLVPRKHLPRYFQYRQQALPFALIALLAVMYFFSGTIFLHIQLWWLNSI